MFWVMALLLLAVYALLGFLIRFADRVISVKGGARD